MKLTSALVLAATLTSGCANWTDFADPSPPPTEAPKTLCAKLQEVRPNYSIDDTPETKRQGVIFLNRLDALCPR